MYSVSFDKARDNFSQIVTDTIQGNEEVVIVTEKGSVVMVNESDWESAKEMLRLLKDKKSLAALLDGHQQREKGLTPEAKTVEQVFNDL